jgi:hypothetical protein
VKDNLGATQQSSRRIYDEDGIDKGGSDEEMIDVEGTKRKGV